MTMPTTTADTSLDQLFDELAESGELKVIEIDENTEFSTVSFDSILDMLKKRILDNLPLSVSDEIRRNGRAMPTR